MSQVWAQVGCGGRGRVAGGEVGLTGEVVVGGLVVAEVATRLKRLPTLAPETDGVGEVAARLKLAPALGSWSGGVREVMRCELGFPGGKTSPRSEEEIF